jgi:hypothetical protein
MKDFISKVTFGFLMAQLVPGIIAIYAVSFAFIAFSEKEPLSIEILARNAVGIWSSTLTELLIFLSLSLGAGMAIHGLHWAVLGFLESHNAKQNNNGTKKLNRVYETFWHNWRPILQIIVGPIKIVTEILLFLFTPKNISEIAIEENIPEIPNEKIEAFKFLQEFYLHFLQFYAHTAYALIMTLLLIIISIIFSPGLECSAKCLVSALIVWFACGFFFLISRIQIGSLFMAENKLKDPK